MFIMFLSQLLQDIETIYISVSIFQEKLIKQLKNPDVAYNEVDNRYLRYLCLHAELNAEIKKIQK